MKRVVQNKKEETIDLDSIDWTNPQIGIINEGKNFLHKSRRDGFDVVSFDAENRNLWASKSSGSTFRGAVEKAISNDFEVYVFDSSKELFLWLAE